MWQSLVALVIGAVIGCMVGLGISMPQSVQSSKLLEWPFLLFVWVSIIVVLFYQPIHKLLGRGDIRIKWGEDKEIQLKDLSPNFDKEIDPIASDVDQLKKDLEELRARFLHSSISEKPGGGTAASRGTAPGDPGGDFHDDAWKTMYNAILGSQYKWRRVSALANLAGVDEEQALGILDARDEVMLGRNKEGFRIATLKSKINRDASGD